MHKVALIGFVLAAATAAHAQRDTAFSWRGLPPGGRITIRTYDGEIELSPGNGDRLEVRAHVRVRPGGDARDVGFEVADSNRSDLLVCTTWRGVGCDRSGSISDA